jgi:hypothetical protein
MDDRPQFEIFDGAVVHPLITPGVSPAERSEAERLAALAYYYSGGGGDLLYLDGYRAVRERE